MDIVFQNRVWKTIFFYCHDNIPQLEGKKSQKLVFYKVMLHSPWQPREEGFVSKKPVGTLGAVYLVGSVLGVW